MAKFINKIGILIRYILTYNYYFFRVYALATVTMLKQCFESSKHLRIEYAPQGGVVAIITGGSSGIGFEVSHRLCALGAHVVIGGKCPRDGANVLKEIWSKLPSAKVDYIQLDLSSRASINDFSGKFKKMGLPLHILLHNAGTMMMPYQKTVDGLEEQIAVNYAGPWLLTQNLLDVLKKTGTATRRARIVNVSSVGHIAATFPDVEALLKSPRCTKAKKNGNEIVSSIYSPHASYAESKLLSVMHAYTLQRRLSQEQALVTASALHPGVAPTRLYRHILLPFRAAIWLFGVFILKTPAQCADSVLPVLIDKELEGSGGRYYSNGWPISSSAVSYDEQLQTRLWNCTCELWEKSGESL